MTTTNNRSDPGAATPEAADPDVQRIQQEIEETRAGMSSTLSALETRLAPSEIREKVGIELGHVEDRVREVVHEQLNDAKKLVQTELQEAKQLIRSEMNEAEQKVRQGLSDARERVKTDVNEALTGAKRAVRAATVGRVEDLATTLGDKMNETRDTLVDTVRNNPIPAALFGVGLAWLLMNRSKSASARRHGGNGERFRAGGYDESPNLRGRAESALSQTGSALGAAAQRASDAAGRGARDAVDAAGNALHGASEAASGLMHKASDAASHLVEDAGHAASSVADGARKGARYVESGFSDALQKNPVAVGAGALALGAIVGFALPRSDKEDALMGQARDQVLHRAGDAAHQAVESATGLADASIAGAKQAMQDSAGH